MSQKRKLLIAGLAILVVAVSAFFLKSVFEKPSPTTDKNPILEPETVSTETVAPATILEPLPSDTKEAIDGEITNITTEIEASIETSIDDLSGLENEL